MYIFKSVNKGVIMKFYDGKKVCRINNIPVKYTLKAFGQSFLNYIEPVYFNSMSSLCKINVYCIKLNPKKII
jgi:hypothetical protein